MIATAEATPRPWYTKREKISRGWVRVTFHAMLPDFEGTLFQIDVKSGHENEANAEYIRQAVNQHDTLLSFVRYYGSLSPAERNDAEISEKLAHRARTLITK